MVTLLLHLLRLLPMLCGGHRQVALENLALRHQLAVYKKMVNRPKLLGSDRLFWVALSRVWAGWRQALVFVSPNTVLRWYWARLSARAVAGRPRVSPQIRALVVRMAQANPLWGAPRIHGELQKLGIDVAGRTVSRLLPKRRSPPSQTWRTFLTNHVRDLVSIDFFTVPTARLRVLFVFVVLAHDRRRVLHFNVTAHPTAAWTAQQIVDAFPDDSAPAYLLRDRDSVYGHVFRQRVKGMGVGEVLTTPQSPWQNPFAERLIGSIRRECLDHVVVLGERHLRRILTAYFAYYHRTRTHLSLEKDAPDGRHIEPPSLGAVLSIPEVGGLHHRYIRRAAQYQDRPVLSPPAHAGCSHGSSGIVLGASENLVPTAQGRRRATRTPGLVPVSSVSSPRPRTDVHQASRTPFWRRTGTPRETRRAVPSQRVTA